MSLTEACGRISAAPVTARLFNPPADVSSMDGYAVRAADTTEGAKLHVIGDIPAGHPSDRTVTPGTCLRIFTGSLVPAGADAIDLLPGVTYCVANFNQTLMRLGVERYRSRPISASPFKLFKALGICGYAISPRGARRLLDVCLPLQNAEYWYRRTNETLRNTSLDRSSLSL